MKHLYILFISSTFLILFSSCRDETVLIDEPIIDIDPPTEIDYPVFVGKVSNQSEAIAGVNIKIYQNDMLIDSVRSDDEGKYTTATVVLEDNAFVTLLFEEDQHVTAYRRRGIEASNTIKTLDVHLLHVQDVQEVAPSIPNPGSNNYFSLSGYIKDLNGGPSSAFIGIQYEYPAPGSGNLAYWGHAQYPDQNGYYEFLLPKDVDLLICVQDTFCEDYITEFDDRIFRQLEAEAFGPYLNDIVLPDFINPKTSYPLIQVNGQLADCNATPIDIGEVYFRLIEANGNDYTIVKSITDGNFDLIEEDCKALPIDLSVWTYDPTNNKFSDTLQMTINESDFFWNIGTLEACNPGIPSQSEITLTVDGTTFSFNDIKPRWEGSNIVSDEVTASAATFVIPNAVIGTNNIENLEMFSFFSGIAFNGVTDSVSVNFSTLNTDFAIGSIQGLFTDLNGNPVSGSGSINLIF